jgi:hypothetical protein
MEVESATWASAAAAAFTGDAGALIPVLLCVLCLVLLSLLLGGKDDGSKNSNFQSAVVGEVEDILRSVGHPMDGRICDEGTSVPSKGLFLGNSEEAMPIETDMLSGRCLAMHRATYDKELDKSGAYRYGEYFLGKKRLWELRFQFQFKRTPPAVKDVMIGIELEDYVETSAATKKMMAIIVENLKTAVGKNIYHTIGDDPKRVTGPLERPAFVMPLYAFDQFIVTPPGESPPSLMDPSMPTLGSTRAGRVRKYKKEIDALQFQIGYTYTFNFWGISQWLDRMNWQVIMPLVRTRVDFDTFCGSPPVHCVLYTLKETGSNGDTRHLQHKKQYLFDLAFWSSKRRPPKEKVEALFKGVPRKSVDVPSSDAQVVMANRRTTSKVASDQRGLFSAFASCCTSRSA